MHCPHDTVEVNLGTFNQTARLGQIKAYKVLVTLLSSQGNLFGRISDDSEL